MNLQKKCPNCRTRISFTQNDIDKVLFKKKGDIICIRTDEKRYTGKFFKKTFVKYKTYELLEDIKLDGIICPCCGIEIIFNYLYDKEILAKYKTKLIKSNWEEDILYGSYW